MFRAYLLLFLAAAAAAAAPATQQATCGAGTVSRVCSALGGAYQAACESGDTCSMPQNIGFAQAPVFLNATLCRSPCLNDADCTARFGAKASCVRDGHAEGFYWEGSFCAVRVLDAANADQECAALATDVRSSMAIDGADLPTGDIDEAVLTAFQPCTNPNSTTCMCAFLCTLPEPGGCVASGTLMQFAYLPGNTFWNTTKRDFEHIADGQLPDDNYACPDGQFATMFYNGSEGMTSASTATDDDGDGEEGSPFCSVSCGEGSCAATAGDTVIDACVSQLLVGNYQWQIDISLAPIAPPYIKQACVACEQDSDCATAASPLASGVCLKPDPAFAHLMPPVPPFAVGYSNGSCAYYCVSPETRAQVEAPQCVPGRFGFGCVQDGQCAPGLQCLTPPGTCTLPCNDTVQCIAALGDAAAADQIECTLGHCALACASDAACEASRYAPAGAGGMPPYDTAQCVAHTSTCYFLCEDDNGNGGGLSTRTITLIVLIVAGAALVLCLIVGIITLSMQRARRGR